MFKRNIVDFFMEMRHQYISFPEKVHKTDKLIVKNILSISQHSESISGFALLANTYQEMRVPG